MLISLLCTGSPLSEGEPKKGKTEKFEAVTLDAFSGPFKSVIEAGSQNLDPIREFRYYRRRKQSVENISAVAGNVFLSRQVNKRII
jgi:hypothetical protein